MSVKLVDLEPSWVGSGGEGIHDAHGNPVPARERVGISFNCPCGKHTNERWADRVFVIFANPPDGGPPVGRVSDAHWNRTGDSFDVLTLTPSIQRVGGCGWHGFVTNGEVLP